MINPETGESLVEFPCHFLFKVTSKNVPGFEERIIELLREVDPSLGSHKVTRNFSKTQKYVALSINVYVTELSQIHRVYELLKSDPDILWGL